MREYITKDGDRLDLIINNHYGTLNTQLFNAVMKANRHITYTSVFRAGIKIFLPDLAGLQTEQPSLKLWDVVRRG